MNVYVYAINFNIQLYYSQIIPSSIITVKKTYSYKKLSMKYSQIYFNTEQDFYVISYKYVLQLNKSTPVSFEDVSKAIHIIYILVSIY